MGFDHRIRIQLHIRLISSFELWPFWKIIPIWISERIKNIGQPFCFIFTCTTFTSCCILIYSCWKKSNVLHDLKITWHILWYLFLEIIMSQSTIAYITYWFWRLYVPSLGEAGKVWQYSFTGLYVLLGVMQYSTDRVVYQMVSKSVVQDVTMVTACHPLGLLQEAGSVVAFIEICHFPII